MSSRHAQHHLDLEKEALHLFQLWRRTSQPPIKHALIAFLLACRTPQALRLGKRIHALSILLRIHPDVALGTSLLVMYGKCGSIHDARQAFLQIHPRNVFAWTAMIGACAKHGYGEQAFKLFHSMQQEGVTPNRVTFISLLGACSGPDSLALGRHVHAQVVHRGLESDAVVGNALVSMYGRCQSVEEARTVFDKMQERDVASWNSMISAYTQHGYGQEAFQLFHRMQKEGLKPNKITFISILNACSRPEDLALGEQVHALVADCRVEEDVVVGTALLSMYGKCGSIENAYKMFNRMPQRNVVSWNAMIAASTRNGCSEEAFKIFHEMQKEGMNPDKITFISILNACSSPEALALGKELHALIVLSGFESDVVVGSALVCMYGRCKSFEDALRVFNKMDQRDVASWNAIIATYAQHGCGEEALKILQRMHLEGVKPDKVTFISILNGCASPETLALGERVHALISGYGIELDVVMGSALVSMYGRCKSIKDARMVFSKMHQRDVASWNAMIAACAGYGYGEEALKNFHQMQREGVKPNKITFICILNACSTPEALGLGKQVHDLVIANGIESDVVVGTALVRMYGDCGSIEDVRKVFDKMGRRNVISWTARITASVRCGYGDEAFQLFCKMRQEGVKPNKITLISILNACIGLAILSLGKQIHAYIVDNSIELDGVVGTALVNMYSKCGSLEDAQRVFNEMHQRNVVAWTAMISACAHHGCGKEALQLFQQMGREGMKPDGVTLTSVLCACSHAKLVDEGLHFFNSMRQEYGIIPTVEHCNCIVDLLGRAGRLDEAEDFIDKMPCQSNAVTWMTLLGSCSNYGCIERGKHAAEQALKLDPRLASAYVVLSNIYAAAGRWDDVAEVRKMMVNGRVKKEHGRSWIEVNSRVHEFVVGDTSHPQTLEIYAGLKKLIEQIKEAGYVPDTSLVLHDVEEEQKEELMCYHSEKLAIAFGLIKLPPGIPLRVMKNIRVCRDCHIATKFISKLASREIILRDASRFHHFKDGVCSCGGYW